MSLTCSYDPYDIPELYREVYRISRKKHKCCECGKEIPVGQEYQVCEGKWDGFFRTFKTCEKCADLRSSLEDAGWCPAFGDLSEEYDEYLDNLEFERRQTRERRN